MRIVYLAFTFLLLLATHLHGASPVPGIVTGISFTGITSASARISWTKPAGYVNSKLTTLVFLKAGSAVTAGTPTLSPLRYTANPNFPLATSKYENDVQAYAMFRGDTNFVNITGINNSTTYHALIWVIADVDSVYSPAATASGTAAPVPPFYYIGQINHVHAVTGVPDSNNVRVRVRGVVYGFNQRDPGKGIMFTIRDQTGGIVITDTTKTFGYTVKEGDSIEASGTVIVNRGLTQVSLLDTVIKRGSNKPLKPVIVADTLKEIHESDLVKVRNLSFYMVPLGFVWDDTVYYCQPYGRTDTIAVRVLAQSSIMNKSFPAGFVFNVTGVVTQVSSKKNPPFAFNGYELLVRSEADIEVVPMLSPFDLQLPVNNVTVDLNGDTAQKVTFSWTASVPFDMGPSLYLWMLDSLAGNFNTPYVEFLSGNGGLDTSITISYGILRKWFTDLSIDSGELLGMKWRALSNTALDTRASNQVYYINMIMGAKVTGVEQEPLQQLSVYPNPFRDELQLRLDAAEQCTAELYDITGRLQLTAAISGMRTQLSTSALAPGIYFLRVHAHNGTLTRKLVKQ